MIYNVITVKFGNKYDSEFVNKLFREICYFSRGYYINRWFNFYCYTDNPEGLMHGINVIPAKTDPTLKGVWNKLRLFDPSMPCLLYTSPSPRDSDSSRMPSSA